MSDLSTTYLGLELRCPLIASASPLTGSIDDLLVLDDAGVGAVVLPSLFEEEIESESPTLHLRLEHGTGSSPEAADYLAELEFATCNGLQRQPVG